MYIRRVNIFVRENITFGQVFGEIIGNIGATSLCSPLVDDWMIFLTSRSLHCVMGLCELSHIYAITLSRQFILSAHENRANEYSWKALTRT